MARAVQEAYHDLEERILGYLAGPDDAFEDLALEVFRFQFAHNAPYRAYCESLPLPPAEVRRWHEIPPVPAQAFRGEQALSCFPPEVCARVFLTSGTTSDQRGRHSLYTLRLYEESIHRGWIDAGLPVALPALFLARPPAETPDSSLACMFEFLHERATPLDSPWMLSAEGTIDRSALDRASRTSAPLVLFSTALALRHLFERLPDPSPLPPGSWVFQTGGYKGLASAYDPATLAQDVETRLGVPPDRLINEYGMTELSSPSYALGTDAPHRTPPWLRVRTIDPETNRPAAPGQCGHLVFHDLANLNSVAAVRTQDLGCALDEHTFTLSGRDSSAPPRGCSRASDAHLQKS